MNSGFVHRCVLALQYTQYFSKFCKKKIITGIVGLEAKTVVIHRAVYRHRGIRAQDRCNSQSSVLLPTLMMFNLNVKCFHLTTTAFSAHSYYQMKMRLSNQQTGFHAGFRVFLSIALCSLSLFLVTHQQFKDTGHYW